jgi:chromate reductase
MKILAFAASNSSESINNKLIHYTTSLIQNHDIELIDINAYEVVIYSTERQKNDGIPTKIQELAQKIDGADTIIISFAEHNGTYTTAFKNIFDWLSVMKERSTWGDKNMFLMATSPGPRGGIGVLETAEKRFPFNGGKVIATYSLPSFSKTFHDTEGITDEAKKQELLETIERIF